MANKFKIPDFISTGLFGNTASKIKNRKKQINKSTCEARGGKWDEESGTCVKPSRT